MPAGRLSSPRHEKLAWPIQARCRLSGVVAAQTALIAWDLQSSLGTESLFLDAVFWLCYQGTTFSRAVKGVKENWALDPVGLWRPKPLAQERILSW